MLAAASAPLDRTLVATDAFGLLVHGSDNLGDEIQSLAARRFLPRVDHLILREDLTRDPGDNRPIRTIFNGWFLHHAHKWPPHPRIHPLLISMHISTIRRSRLRRWWPIPSRVLLAPDRIGYLRDHGPVGARDPVTLDLLREHGVEAWLSGCLTLTLPRYEGPRGDRVVACDLPPSLVAALARRTRHPPLITTHRDRTSERADRRMAKAGALLDTYARAKAVVTSRLHCALPCLALGTPVLFVLTLPDAPRQAPALELARSGSPEDPFAAFDPEDPPSNPDRHVAYARELTRRCQAFLTAAGSPPGQASPSAASGR